MFMILFSVVVSAMKTVLVVDAKMQVRQLIKEYLEEEAVSVLEASDSREALSVLEQGSVDVVLIDTLMPGGEAKGLFLLKTVDTSLDHDISKFLEKPFSRSELRSFISQSIDQG